MPEDEAEEKEEANGIAVALVVAGWLLAAGWLAGWLDGWRMEEDGG